MTTFDFSPLYRTSVGFDRLASLLSSAQRVEQGAYPPYNILAVDENHYQISMAVAGFGEGDLELTTEQNVLTVKGKRAEDEETEGRFLHRGIANRAFERRFNLAYYVRVTAAKLENGCSLSAGTTPKTLVRFPKASCAALTLLLTVSSTARLSKPNR